MFPKIWSRKLRNLQEQVNNIQQLWFVTSVASPTASVNASESVVVPRIPRTTAFCLLEKGPVMSHDVPKVRKASRRIAQDPSPVHRNKVARHLNPCGEAEGKRWPVATAKPACILKVRGSHFHPWPEVWVFPASKKNTLSNISDTSARYMPVPVIVNSMSPRNIHEVKPEHFHKFLDYLDWNSCIAKAETSRRLRHWRLLCRTLWCHLCHMRPVQSQPGFEYIKVIL